MTKLDGVHPRLVDAITRVMDAMNVLGYPMMVTDGLRTDAQQARLYAQGRTTVGPIVTQCNGATTRSNHQAHADGYGHAVDCCFIGIDGKPTWAASMPWKAYGACCEALGLVWGGSWTTLHDLPHAELPETKTVAA